MNLIETEIWVSLRLAPGEPTVRELESQGRLLRLYEGLQAAGITRQHQMFFRDAAGGPSDLVGQFVVPIAQIVIPVLGGVLVVWLKGRVGRKVRLKIGDVEAEATTPEEVEKLLLRAKEFQQGSASSKGVTPEQPRDESNLTSEQMRAGIYKIRLRVADLQKVNVAALVERGDPNVIALEKSIEETLERVFGGDTREYSRYREASTLHLLIATFGGRRSHPGEIQQEFIKCRDKAIALLNQAIKGLEEELAEGRPQDIGDADRAEYPLSNTHIGERAMYSEVPLTETDRTWLREKIAAGERLRAEAGMDSVQGWRTQILSRLTRIDRRGDNWVNATSCRGQWELAGLYQNHHPTNPYQIMTVLEQSLGVLNEIMGSGIWLIKEPPAEEPLTMAIPSLTDVFIVHGHDGEAREAVARFIEKLGLKAIILHERANEGRTIVEKFEAHADVNFAVVLLTPDDVGGPRDGPQQPRARQNVVLELGYFIGKLGRRKVCAIKSGQLEIPSDIFGVVWTPYDAHGAWRSAIANELQAAGFKIDWNKVMRP